jgi:Protein of unknown function (DUF2800)
MAAHAACGPSSASMWLQCPASITRTAGMTRPSSKFAREGTAAHHVAELILRGDPFLPDKIEVEGEEFIVSGSMCRALNPYVTHVENLLEQPDAVGVIEEHVVVPLTRNKVWGTVDCGVAVQRDLHVVDLKFGRGVLVPPDSAQLKLYGLGLAWVFRDRLEKKSLITLTVCQPRFEGIEPLRSHTLLLAELIKWQHDVVTPAIERIHKNDQTEVVGAHCRWCVRQTECAAFANRHQGKAASVFDDADDPNREELFS